MPTEVWVLRTEFGFAAKPALDDDGTDSFLAWPSEEQAKQGAMFQVDNGYYGKVEIVRLL